MLSKDKKKAGEEKFGRTIKKTTPKKTTNITVDFSDNEERVPGRSRWARLRELELGVGQNLPHDGGRQYHQKNRVNFTELPHLFLVE